MSFLATFKFSGIAGGLGISYSGFKKEVAGTWIEVGICVEV